MLQVFLFQSGDGIGYRCLRLEFRRLLFRSVRQTIKCMFSEYTVLVIVFFLVSCVGEMHCIACHNDPAHHIHIRPHTNSLSLSLSHTHTHTNCVSRLFIGSIVVECDTPSCRPVSPNQLIRERTLPLSSPDPHYPHTLTMLID